MKRVIDSLTSLKRALIVAAALVLVLVDVNMRGADRQTAGAVLQQAIAAHYLLATEVTRATSTYYLDDWLSRQPFDDEELSSAVSRIKIAPAWIGLPGPSGPSVAWFVELPTYVDWLTLTNVLAFIQFGPLGGAFLWLATAATLGLSVWYIWLGNRRASSLG